MELGDWRVSNAVVTKAKMEKKKMIKSHCIVKVVVSYGAAAEKRETESKTPFYPITFPFPDRGLNFTATY